MTDIEYILKLQEQILEVNRLVLKMAKQSNEQSEILLRLTGVVQKLVDKDNANKIMK